MSKSPEVIRRKAARILAGKAPRVLDLFSGCGGLSLGFQAAGCKIRAAIEIDPDAARTHGFNFHPGDDRHAVPRDITATTPQELAADLDLGPIDDAIDIIVGGPPCQAFARVGRPKLREVDLHPHAFIYDERAGLYRDYLRYVEAFQPLAVLVENVPDALNHGGRNIAEEIARALVAKGYVCSYTLLNAAYYGVPQTRERMFLLAYRKEVAESVEFPVPTHWVDLPNGYESSRAVALKVLNGLFDQAHSYVDPPVADESLAAVVTAEEAIGDLPSIFARRLLASGQLRRGARRFDTPIAYDRRRKVSPYAETMRSWPGFGASEEGLKDHVIRWLPRDYEIFARMKPGDQYPEANRIALGLLEEKLSEMRRRGLAIPEKSALMDELRAAIVPPYDAGKFPNKWRKMWRDKPARTVMAHIGKDSYSHIHYDDEQARTISVREAARLQSFPDGFVFSGTMNPAFRQIGNAVPPLMAKALAGTMMVVLREQRPTAPALVEARARAEAVVPMTKRKTRSTSPTGRRRAAAAVARTGRTTRA